MLVRDDTVVSVERVSEPEDEDPDEAVDGIAESEAGGPESDSQDEPPSAPESD
jgi:hypothetical protein